MGRVMSARRLATSLVAVAGSHSLCLSQAGPADVEDTGDAAREEPAEAAAGPPSPPNTEDELSASLLSRRRLFLLGDVTDDSANALIKRLLWLEAAAPGEPVELIINSSGGSLWAGFALLDTMRAISSPVHTCCLGRCRSMAAVLLAAGEPGHRYASASSRLMIHQPYWDQDIVGSYAQAEDLSVQARESERQRRHWASTLGELTRADADALDARMARDVHLTAVEAVELGLVDHVLAGLAGTAAGMRPAGAGGEAEAAGPAAKERKPNAD